MILETEAEPVDAWAAHAQAWRDRRQSVGEMLRQRDVSSIGHGDSHCHDARPTEAVPSCDLRPIKHYQLYPIIPPRRLESTYAPRVNNWPANPEQSQQIEYDEGYQPTQRPLPKLSYGSYTGPESRRQSGASQAHSYAGSLAEELHPELFERSQPPPQFGRYSGGMDYGYEYGVGFGGSAGMRTVSGAAGGIRKGVPLAADYGVDLGDVPIIAGLRRL